MIRPGTSLELGQSGLSQWPSNSASMMRVSIFSNIFSRWNNRIHNSRPTRIISFLWCIWSDIKRQFGSHHCCRRRMDRPVFWPSVDLFVPCPVTFCTSVSTIANRPKMSTRSLRMVSFQVAWSCDERSIDLRRRLVLYILTRYRSQLTAFGYLVWILLAGQF